MTFHVNVWGCLIIFLESRIPRLVLVRRNIINLYQSYHLQSMFCSTDILGLLYFATNRSLFPAPIYVRIMKAIIYRIIG
jgi:hypothetical protein